MYLLTFLPIALRTPFYHSPLFPSLSLPSHETGSTQQRHPTQSTEAPSVYTASTPPPGVLRDWLFSIDSRSNLSSSQTQTSSGSAIYSTVAYIVKVSTEDEDYYYWQVWMWHEWRVSIQIKFAKRLLDQGFKLGWQMTHMPSWNRNVWKLDVFCAKELVLSLMISLNILALFEPVTWHDSISLSLSKNLTQKYPTELFDLSSLACKTVSVSFSVISKYSLQGSEELSFSPTLSLCVPGGKSLCVRLMGGMGVI